jgi:peptidyl-prolyl cis-trans isomerase A (cyclophilin A)
VVNNAPLDQPISGGAGYAVFGKVIAGMDVVEIIKVVPVTNRGGHQHVPAEPVVIEKVRRISEEDAKKAVEREKKADEKSEGGDS